MYRSPIAISGLNPADFSADAAPRAALLLARRKLEAELELSGSDEIRIAGALLNRQDIVRLFDELGDAKQLQYHLAIAGDPPLQRFLETGQLEPGVRWLPNELYEDGGFLFFVSQYYAEATDALYRSVLKGEQGISALQALAATPSLMLGSDSERAFRTATRYFIDRKNALLHLLYEAKAGHNYSKDDVKAAAPESDLYVLNSLPGGFEDLRYEIASALNNTCVAFDKHNRPKPALAAIERAAMVHLEGGELITLIPNNLKLVRNKQPGFRFFNYSDSGKKTPKVGAIIALFILIIRIFGGVNGCNHDSYQATPGYSITQEDVEPGYHSNMAALLRNLSTESSTTMPSSDTLRLSKPVEGKAPFEALFRIVEGDSAIRYEPSAKGNLLPKNHVRLVNQTPWDVILFYTRDQSTANTFYVPPGKTKTLDFAAMDLSLDFTAGSHWEDTASRLITERQGHFAFKTHRVTGWYTQQPANLGDFVQPGQSLINAMYDSTSKSALVLTFSRTGQFSDSLTLNVDTAILAQPAAGH